MGNGGVVMGGGREERRREEECESEGEGRREGGQGYITQRTNNVWQRQVQPCRSLYNNSGRQLKKALPKVTCPYRKTKVQSRFKW